MLYFDHNATTPLLAEARQAWLEACDQYVGNPSSPHRLGASAEAALENARERLAALLQCRCEEIVWTSGATESNNMVLHHFARTLARDAQIWLSAGEHPCVLESARYYFPDRLRLIPLQPAGTVDLDWLSREIRQMRPGLVAVMAANNETGVLQPWREAFSICRDYNVPFLCDAVQWIGKLPARGLGACDFLSGSAHKFGGPRGVGFLKCGGRCPVQPLLCGGPQENGRRAGTENVPGVLAAMAALEIREKMLADNKHLVRLSWRKHFEKSLEQQLPETLVVGAQSDRLWNTVSAIMPETSSRQRWVVKLDRFGYAVSTGSACSSGKEEASHVLAAMGFPPEAAARALRFSSGWESAEADWEELMAALIRASAALRMEE